MIFVFKYRCFNRYYKNFLK